MTWRTRFKALLSRYVPRGNEQNRPDRISHANVVPKGIAGRTRGGRKRGDSVERSFECIIVIGPTITHRTKSRTSNMRSSKYACQNAFGPNRPSGR